jgi:hypothetical protein
MGMFDNIRCEYPLPGNPPANAAELDFQTKDLESLLQNLRDYAGRRFAA